MASRSMLPRTLPWESQVGRRSVLKGTMAFGAAALLGGCGGDSGAGSGTVRFLHNETDPSSIKFFEAAIKAYEKKNPGVTVDMETVSTDGRLQRILSLQAARQLPGVFKILPEERYTFATKGVIEPLDDVVDSVGRSSFVNGALVPVKGQVYDVPYTFNQFSVNYVRQDLVDSFGTSDSWQAFADASQSLTTGGGSSARGTFGTVIPAGLTRMNDIYFAQIFWSEGGTFFDENFKVSLDSGGAAVRALEIIRALASASPPGIEAYSYSDMEAAFLTGKIAQEVYAPRVVAAVAADAPQLLPQIQAGPRLTGGSGIGIGYANPNTFAVATSEFGNDDVDAAKDFLRYIVSAEKVREFSLTAYPHMIPPLKGIGDDLLQDSNPVNNESPELVRASFDLTNTMDFTTEAGAEVQGGALKLTGRFNPYSPNITTRFIGANMVQNVLIRRMPPSEAVSEGMSDLQTAVAEMS